MDVHDVMHNTMHMNSMNGRWQVGRVRGWHWVRGRGGGAREGGV